MGPAGGRGRGSHPDNSRFVVNISGGGGGVRCRQYRVSQKKRSLVFEGSSGLKEAIQPSRGSSKILSFTFFI